MGVEGKHANTPPTGIAIVFVQAVCTGLKTKPRANRASMRSGPPRGKLGARPCSCRLITSGFAFARQGDLRERRRPTPTVKTQVHCYFPCSGRRQAGKILLSVRVGSGYLGNSLDSLHRSLPAGTNLLLLGRICRILSSRKENSLLNSLKQGIWDLDREVSSGSKCVYFEWRPGTESAWQPLLRDHHPHAAADFEFC